VLGPPRTGGSAKKRKKKTKGQNAAEAAAAQKARARAQLAEGRKQRRRRVTERTEAITRFIRAAGVSVEIASDFLVVDGRRSIRIDALANAQFTVNQFIDAIVARSCPRVLLEQLRRQLEPLLERHLTVKFDRRTNTFLIRDASHGTLGKLRATSASVGSVPLASSNYLLPGRQWDEVRRRLSAASTPDEDDAAQPDPIGPPTVESPRPSKELVTSPPPGLEAFEVAQALDASRRLRTERQVAYGQDVVLVLSDAELTLHPVAGKPGAIVLPFRASFNNVATEGSILLQGSDDPLGVILESGLLLPVRARTWFLALTGAAAATCFEADPSPPPASKHRAATIGRRSRRGTGGDRDLPLRGPKWPSELEPIGHWTHHGPCVVVGHRRHLSRGTASAEAVKRAQSVGISLRPGETWGQPHVRGGAHIDELRFRWRRGEPR
jgi:hypothetical protein